MICKKCGSLLPDNSTLCPHCAAAGDAAQISGRLIIRMGSQGSSGKASQEQPRSPFPAPRAYCPQCGTPINNNDSLCIACAQKRQITPAIAEKRNVNKRPRILLGVLGVLVALLVAFFVYSLLASDAQTQDDIPLANPDHMQELPQLDDGQILARGDAAAAVAYATQIVQTEDLACTYLYDMNGDNVCELILCTKRSEADAMFHFYSYYDGYLHKFSSISAGHSSLYIQDDTLIAHYGHMGYEQVTELTVQNGELVCNCVLDHQLADEEDYLSFSQEPCHSDVLDLTILEYIYPLSEDLVVNTTADYTAKAGYYTNGVFYYACLPNGYVLSVDAATGKVTVPLRLTSDTVLFFVTENRLYFQTDNISQDEMVWGKTVFSCKTDGSDSLILEDGVNVTCRDGIVLLESYRSDVSPVFITAIDSDDHVFLSDVYAWDATIYDGSVYYCELDPDTFWDNSTSYELPLYRTHGSDRVHIANLFIHGAYDAVSFSEPYILVHPALGGNLVCYDLVTGKLLD